MSTYRPQKLVEGHKVAKKFIGMMLVAIQPAKLEDGFCEIYFDGGMMYVKNTDDPIFVTGPYEDKYGRTKSYYLHYYEWKPTKQEALL